MIFNVHVTGLGGQGVLTSTRILAAYTQAMGLKTTMFNSKGMAQRGGRVTSDIRITESNTQEFDPRIADGTADVVIGMELGECLNSRTRVATTGTVLLYKCRIVPAPLAVGKTDTYPRFEEAQRQYANRAQRLYLIPEVRSGANVYLLGVLCALLPTSDRFIELDLPRFEAVLCTELKHNQEDNLTMFRTGYRYGQNLV